jgi:cytochrome c oxidase subunit 2
MSPIRRADGVTLRRALAAAAASAASACHPAMSIFGGATESGARVAHLTWFMIILAPVIFALVVGLLIGAMLHNRARDPNALDLTTRGSNWVIWGGAVLPTIILVAIFVVGMTTMGHRANLTRDAVTIRVTGHQWWWEVEYADSDLTKQFVTANEIHVPVGKPVHIVLNSADVIHSFWVPNLQGKLDLIPGHTNDLQLTVNRPGVYRGQCAEYCGLQHANMAMEVIAEDSMTFRRWEEAQRGPASLPADSELAYGRQVFMTGPCALCHTIRGSDARGQIGPDLTHIGSRGKLAAATIPNKLGELEAWITDAQSFKPGTKMPSLVRFNGRELRSLAAYVASLR